MAKPNYSFAKRQRDLAKKQKKEEKRLRKLEAHQASAQQDPAQPPAQDDLPQPAGDEPTAA